MQKSDCFEVLMYQVLRGNTDLYVLIAMIFKDLHRKYNDFQRFTQKIQCFSTIYTENTMIFNNLRFSTIYTENTMIFNNLHRKYNDFQRFTQKIQLGQKA